MFRACAAAILMLVVLWARTALAEDARPCGDALDERTMAACLRLRDAADLDRIEKLGLKIKQHMDEGNFAETFDAAHRAWLVFRAAECKSKTWESANGSGYASILESCLLDLNTARIKDLEFRADSP